MTEKSIPKEIEPKRKLDPVEPSSKDVARYLYTSFEFAQGDSRLQGTLYRAEVALGIGDKLMALDNSEREKLREETLGFIDEKMHLPGKHIRANVGPGSVFNSELKGFFNTVHEAKHFEEEDVEDLSKKVLLGLLERDIEYQHKRRPGREHSVEAKNYDTRKDPHASYLRRFLENGDTRVLHPAHRDYLEGYVKPMYDRYSKMSLEDARETSEDPLGTEIVERMVELEGLYKGTHPQIW